jgi:glucan phosphoethanolaminetransferase (alkaline phosphatase superfamily)
MTGLAGGLLLVAVELSGGAVVNALLTRAGHDLTSAEAMSLFDLAQALLFLFWAGATLFLAASAVLSLKLQALPRWLGGAAAVIVAVSLIAPASTQLLHVPATLFYLWVVAASIVLIRTPREPHADGRDRSGIASLTQVR